MVPPGWNVTEPIRVAYETIRKFQAMRRAPAEAQNFRTNIESFNTSVRFLQNVIQQLRPVIETSKSLEAPLENVDLLETDLETAWRCIQRCEQFSTRYDALIHGNGNFLNRQVRSGRWVWELPEVKDLYKQQQKCMDNIKFKLQIIDFSQSQRPNQHLTVIYENRGFEQGQGSQDHVDRTNADVDQPTPSLGSPVGSHSNRGSMHSISQGAPGGSRPSSSSRRNSTESGIPEERWPPSIRHTRTISTSSWNSEAVLTPITTQHPSPNILPIDRRPSIARSISQVWGKEDEMVDLRGVRVVINRPGSNRRPRREEQALEKIERYSLSNSQEVQILFFPTDRPRYRYVLRFSLIHPVVPKVEHFATEECSVELDARLVAERTQQQQRRDSFASSFTVQSQGSNISDPTNAEHPVVSRSELPEPKFYFDGEETWTRFQELIMGPRVKLAAQFSVEEVTSNIRSECCLQRVRLWHKNQHQYLMFFTPRRNDRPAQHKEFDMMFLADARQKSRSEVKLLVQSPSLQGEGEMPGLTQPVDRDALSRLEYLVIKFLNPEDRDAFVSKARYNGVSDGFSPLPLPFEQSSAGFNDIDLDPRFRPGS